MRKGISLVLAVLLSLASIQLAAQDVTTLKVMIPGDRPADMDKVIAAINAKVQTALGVNINVTFIPWSDLKQKTQLTLAAGDQVDLIFDAPWNTMIQMAAKDYYTDLTPLLEKNGQAIKKAVGADIFAANKFDGKILGIPLTNAPMAGQAFAYREDIRKAIGFGPIKTVDDYIKFLYAVKEKKVAGVTPFLNAYGNGDVFAKRILLQTNPEFNSDAVGFGSPSPVFYTLKGDAKIYNIFDNPYAPLMKYLKLNRQMFVDGIIDQDVASIKELDSAIKSGKYAAYIENDIGVSSSHKSSFATAVPGAEYKAIYFYDFKPKNLFTAFQAWNFMCVPTYSKNKEKAVSFINWAMSSQDNYDLVAYGIKGSNYTLAGEQYQPVGTGYSWFPYAWVWNPKLDRINASYSADDVKVLKFFGNPDNYTKLKVAGFVFDSEPVKREISAFSSIESKYWRMIALGLVDVDTTWAQYKTEAYPLIKTIEVEQNKQFTTWLKKQK